MTTDYFSCLIARSVEEPDTWSEKVFSESNWLDPMALRSRYWRRP